MESTDKLRKAAKGDSPFWCAMVRMFTDADGMSANDAQSRRAGLSLAEEIEREIAEKYMLLPVDADGVPICVGDMVNGGMGDSGKVQHIEIWPDGFVIVYEHHPGQFTRYAADAVRHVKPRTIEDVLYECFHDCMYKYPTGIEPIISKYADELRSMGVGE